MPLMGWVVVTVLLSLFALALFHSVIVNRQTTLDQLNRELEQVQADNDRLQFNVARAEAPDRIVAEALYRLGMVEPDQREYLPPVGFNPRGLSTGGFDAAGLSAEGFSDGELLRGE